MTTAEIIKKMAPSYKVNVDAIAEVLDRKGKDYHLDTPARMQAFLAQAAHETDGFRTLTEYASGKAYEGRQDLGNTQPGDGVKFKGRGIFQITGRTNYGATSKHIYGDDRLLYHPELLSTPEPAAISALNYWNTRTVKMADGTRKHLYQLADEGDLKSITKGINGGLNGWADRLSYYDRIKGFFSTTRK
jgi:putative chitinase